MDNNMRKEEEKKEKKPARREKEKKDDIAKIIIGVSTLLIGISYGLKKYFDKKESKKVILSYHTEDDFVILEKDLEYSDLSDDIYIENFLLYSEPN